MSVHLQILEYMVKIWRLFIKQKKKKRHTAHCDSVVDLPWETIMAKGYDPVVFSVCQVP